MLSTSLFFDSQDSVLKALLCLQFFEMKGRATVEIIHKISLKLLFDCELLRILCGRVTRRSLLKRRTNCIKRCKKEDKGGHFY
jgi:hypothetical protein